MFQIKDRRIKLVALCVLFLVSQNCANTVNNEAQQSNIGTQGPTQFHRHEPTHLHQGAIGTTQHSPVVSAEPLDIHRARSNDGGHGTHGSPHAHDDGGHGTGDDGEEKRFPLVTTDFPRVQTPFIISMWIFCACLGKIGKYNPGKLNVMKMIHYIQYIVVTKLIHFIIYVYI